MDNLTLGEKSYLTEIFIRYGIPGKQAYEVAEAFTKGQRSKFLYLHRANKREDAKDIINNVISFQTKII